MKIIGGFRHGHHGAIQNRAGCSKMTAANPHTPLNRITNPCFSMKNIP